VTFRVYFNRKNEFPQVWSIDYGTQESEINVQRVELINCTAVTVYKTEGVTDFNDMPCAWFEVEAARAVFGMESVKLYGN